MPLTNLRDMGGLACGKDRVLSPAKIYRSSKLSGITEEERTLLDSLSLDTIIDFRCNEELRESPDHIPHGCKYIHKECFDGKDYPYLTVTRLSKLKACCLRGEKINRMKQSKMNSYEEMCDCNAFNELWKCMDRGESFLFHCTEGKDRTGIAAALIEMALGRSEEEALEQYLLSNELRPNKDRSALRFLGIPSELIDAISYCERTHEELFLLAMDTIKKKYGSVEKMLAKKYGITKRRKKKWIKLYTEAASETDSKRFLLKNTPYHSHIFLK